ncbi:hypothetical protein EDC94DRAFT_580363 [Helicostylum pulchrum]|nr:hypothetical protein EDC94DRAFT_580363 [Helicostylum pulchrum]
MHNICHHSSEHYKKLASETLSREYLDAYTRLKFPMFTNASLHWCVLAILGLEIRAKVLFTKLTPAIFVLQVLNTTTCTSAKKMPDNKCLDGIATCSCSGSRVTYCSERYEWFMKWKDSDADLPKKTVFSLINSEVPYRYAELRHVPNFPHIISCRDYKIYSSDKTYNYGQPSNASRDTKLFKLKTLNEVCRVSVSDRFFSDINMSMKLHSLRSSCIEKMRASDIYSTEKMSIKHIEMVDFLGRDMADKRRPIESLCINESFPMFPPRRYTIYYGYWKCRLFQAHHGPLSQSVKLPSEDYFHNVQKYM